MTDTKRGNVIDLEKLPYIYYPVQFWKRRKEVFRALIESSSDVNAITLVYAKQLGLQIRQINAKI